MEVKIDIKELKLLHAALKCHLNSLLRDEGWAIKNKDHIDNIRTLTTKIGGSVQDYNFSRKEIEVKNG